MNGQVRYTRLPGRGIPFFSVLGVSYRLFISDDHLLSIFRNSIVEEYRRFFYRDIQSIQFTPSRRYFILNSVFSAILLLSGIICIVLDHYWSGASKVSAVALMIGLPCALLTGNIIKGRTCRTFLATRVQTFELPSLNRIRTARKVIQMLEPVIRSAQPLWSHDHPLPAPPSNSHISAKAVSNPAATAARITIRWHVYPAILTGILTASSVYDIFFSNNLKNIFDSIMILLLISTDIAAIIQQRNTLIPAVLKASTWSVIFLTFAVLYMTAISQSFGQIFHSNSKWLSVEPSNPFMAVIATLIAVAYAVQALMFLIGLIQYRRQSAGGGA